MAETYYDGSFFDLENPEHRILISDAARSFGRTSYWVNRCTKRAEKNPLKRYIYLRRGDKELEAVIADGFAKNLKLNNYYGTYYNRKKYSIITDAKKIYLENNQKNRILVGYMASFNQIKGIDLLDVDTIIFDEYIATLRRSYKGGNNGVFEPKMLDSFINTVFRRRINANLIFLGNQDTADSPTNPYAEYWHIPFGVSKYKRSDIGLYYRKEKGQGDTGSFANVIARANTDTYARDVLNDVTTIDSLFIAKKPHNADYIAAIKFQSVYITLWIDTKTGILFCHDDYKVDKNKPFYTAFRDNMSIDAALLIAAQYPQLKAIKQKYFTNQIRYNNAVTASRIATIIQVIR